MFFFREIVRKIKDLDPASPHRLADLGIPLKCFLTHQNSLILDYSIIRVDMSAAFLEKLWNIGIIPTKWSLENCDKVAPNTK